MRNRLVPAFVGLALSLSAPLAHAQESAPIRVAASTPAVAPQGHVIIDAEGDAAALSVYGAGGANSVQCTTPCALSMPFGSYTVEASAPTELTVPLRVSAPRQRYVFRRGGVGIGWKVLTIWGSVNAGGGLLLVGLGALGLSSSSGFDQSFGTVALSMGILGLVSGALMLIPGAIGWALAPGPSLREQNDVASIRALRSRRVALLQTGPANPLSFAPSAASALSFAASF